MARGHRSQIKKERNEERDLRPQAHGRYLPVADTKARIVLAEVKGKNVTDAAAILAYSPRYAARLIEKILKSAVANAENNQGLDTRKLYVQEAVANRGTSHQSRWRMRARAKGRGYRIERQFSHISIYLGEK